MFPLVFIVLALLYLLFHFFCPCNFLFVVSLQEIASNSSPLWRKIANIFFAGKPPFVCNRLLPHHELLYSNKYMYSFFAPYFFRCQVIDMVDLVSSLHCIVYSDWACFVRRLVLLNLIQFGAFNVRAKSTDQTMLTTFVTSNSLQAAVIGSMMQHILPTVSCLPTLVLLSFHLTSCLRQIFPIIATSHVFHCYFGPS